MTVPTVPPTAVRSAGNQTSTASRTPSPTGTYTDWRRRDVSTITPGSWHARAGTEPLREVESAAGSRAGDAGEGAVPRVRAASSPGPGARPGGGGDQRSPDVRHARPAGEGGFVARLDAPAQRSDRKVYCLRGLRRPAGRLACYPGPLQSRGRSPRWPGFRIPAS